MDDFDANTVCLTVDVEWSCPEVLADLCRLFEERGLRATFFCTHAGTELPGHERGIHPNFRQGGDCLKALASLHGGIVPADQTLVYRHVVAWFKAFAPEATGVRAHSLFYDSQLLGIYRDNGLRYDSSYQLPLAAGLGPLWKECDILELPIYYSDYFDIKTRATAFDLAGMKFEQKGMKVLNIHPNIIYLNADSEDFYLSTKSFYHDAERLLAQRRPGKGARGLLLRTLDHIAAKGLTVATLGEVNQAWRRKAAYPWPF